MSPRGLMLIGTDDTRAAFARDMETMGMAPMSLADACEMVPVLNPKVVREVGFHAEAWDLDTDRLIQNFAREIRANGGQVLTAARVARIEKTVAGWRIDAPGGPFEARLLFNAAGAWVDEIARLAGVRPIGFTPMRRSIARIPAPGGLDVSRWPMVFGAGEAWYCKPDAGRLLVSPADEDPVEPHDAWAEDLTLAEGIARYEAVVTEPVTRLVSSWAGLRTFSPDRCLVIGPDRDESSFFWVAGQGGYGFQTSPAASQLVADLVAGGACAIDRETRRALDPARFG